MCMPSPSWPTSRSRSMRTPSNITCATGSQCRPIFFSGSAKTRPVGVARHDEGRQAPAPVVGRAGEGRVVVGVAGVRDPGLGALERPAVVGAGRAGRHRGDVRAGEGLGEAVGAELLAGEHAGQQRLLLLARAEGRHGVCREAVHADPDRDAHPDGGDLLDDLEVDLVGLVGAAELLGVGQARAGPARPRVRKASSGKARARSASSTLGARSLRQISRVSSIRSVASSVGISLVAGMRRY